MTSQGARQTAILAAIHTHYLTNGTGYEILPEGDKALVYFAPMIIGVGLSLMVTIMIGVCVLMREKRKRIEEATSLHNLPWIETLEVFALAPGEQAAGIYLPTPMMPSPPAYESVVTLSEKDKEAKEQAKTQPPRSPIVSHTPEQSITHSSSASTPQTPNVPQAPAPLPSDDLPSYEAAVRMDGNI